MPSDSNAPSAPKEADFAIIYALFYQWLQTKSNEYDTRILKIHISINSLHKHICWHLLAAVRAETTYGYSAITSFQ